MTTKISKEGYLTHLYDSSKHSTYKAMSLDKISTSAISGPDRFFIVPFDDLLLDVFIKGTYSSASMYGYDDIGDYRVVWGTTSMEEGGRMCPFPISGVPMRQYRKAVFVDVNDAGDDVQIIAKFASLSEESNKKLNEYRDGVHGVKLKHSDGTSYQILNVGDDMHYILNAIMPVPEQKHKLSKITKSFKKLKALFKFKVSCVRPAFFEKGRGLVVVQ